MVRGWFWESKHCYMQNVLNYSYCKNEEIELKGIIKYL